MKICLKCAEYFSSDGWVCPACNYEPVRLNNIEAHAVEFANNGGGFKAEYFSELANLESSNFWFRARNKLILWALGVYNPNAESFLEVGCGTGFVLSGIANSNPNISLSGSEIFLAGLKQAKLRVPSAKFMQMDARHIPFVDEFDAVGAFDVLEHIELDEVVLTQLHRAVKPEGILFLTVPQHPRLWSKSDEYACHVRRYTGAEIEAKVRDAGFEILKSTSFVTLLLPVMMISRFMQSFKNEKHEFDPKLELKINKSLNWMFYKIMNLEILSIKAGLNLPVGGSRLVICRKPKT